MIKEIDISAIRNTFDTLVRNVGNIIEQMNKLEELGIKISYVSLYSRRAWAALNLL